MAARDFMSSRLELADILHIVKKQAKSTFWATLPGDEGDAAAKAVSLGEWRVPRYILSLIQMADKDGDSLMLPWPLNGFPLLKFPSRVVYLLSFYESRCIIGRRLVHVHDLLNICVEVERDVRVVGQRSKHGQSDIIVAASSTSGKSVERRETHRPEGRVLIYSDC